MELRRGDRAAGLRPASRSPPRKGLPPSSPQGATAHKLCQFGSRSRQQVSTAPESQAVPLVLCLSDSSPRPRGGISSEEYQSIDMGPDSLSEQNTKASSLRSVSTPAHSNCSLGARFPVLWTLGRALRLQGLDSAPSREVRPRVCRGEGGRQADAKTGRREDRGPEESRGESNSPALVAASETSLLLLPVTVPHPKDM